MAGKQERVVRVADLERVRTSAGNVRYELSDENGDRYSTFREGIGERAALLVGHRAKLVFHETKRGEFTNVYLDAVEGVADTDAVNVNAAAGNADIAAEHVGWSAAIDAAPWLVGAEPKRPIESAELFDKLKGFKDRVAEDVRGETSPPKRARRSRT